MSVLRQSLQTIIKAKGPISVASYMHQSLVHPTDGYYVTRDPLGAKGDFTTSPEISQMFGELIGINILTQWMGHGKPSDIRLVELGPGRGTLMADLLRASHSFQHFKNSIRKVELIEASPELKKKQREMLIPLIGSKTTLNWHTSIRELAKDCMPTFIIAHEFFDALPIHQFIKTSDGKFWVERLVDYNSELDRFQFTIAKQPNQMLNAALQHQSRFAKLPPDSEIEVCFDAWEIANQVGSLLKHNAGGALIIDYGPLETIPINTFRGFKSQHQINPLSANPGEADLTADVDFRALQDIFIKHKLYVKGPAKQADWLHRMGIGARATVLSNNKKGDLEGEKRIADAYNRLVDPNNMGKTYKVMGVSTLPHIEGFPA